jgi:organic radical activating enzyme
MKCKYLDHQINIRPDGQYRLCCVSSEPANKENINTHNIVQWIDSPTHKETKKLLSNNIWPSSCTKCETQEKNSETSQRLKSEIYGPGISHLDLRISNDCNLKCISCWNQSSSAIAQEEIDMLKNGVNPLTETVLDSSRINWKIENYIEIIKSNPLKEIYFTGGEPMMVKGIMTLLDHLDSSTKIRFNTNCTIWNKTIEKKLKRFKSVSMALSLDAVDKKIEYIRYGSKWNVVSSNADRYSEFFDVSITPTISVLNCWFYNDIIEYSHSKGWPVYENILFFPQWLSCQNAPQLLKDAFQLKNNLFEQVADHTRIEYFKKKINQLDSWRKIKIKDYLPLVAQAYDIN